MMYKRGILRIGFGILILLSLVAIAVACFSISSNVKKAAKIKPTDPAIASTNSQIEQDHFQGVFLNSGQVYFGKLQRLDSENYKLTDIYYLKDSSNLIKLGNESHKPEDAMIIPVANVTFWENLQNADQFNGQLR